MAKATKVSIAPPPFMVVLELTNAEAQALMNITGKIGGNPSKTPRGCFDNIYAALSDVGYDYEQNVATGGIDFKEGR